MVQGWSIQATVRKRQLEFLASALLAGEIARARDSPYVSAIGGEVPYMGRYADAIIIYLENGVPRNIVLEYANKIKDVNKWPAGVTVYQIIKEHPEYQNDPILRVELRYQEDLSNDNVKILRMKQYLPVNSFI